jgi:hypothetical protein
MDGDDGLETGGRVAESVHALMVFKGRRIEEGHA